MYEDGKGCAIDYSKAMKFFELAADQGYGVAKTRLGRTFSSFVTFLTITRKFAKHEYKLKLSAISSTQKIEVSPAQ